MKQDRARKLRSAQRSMLRLMVSQKRWKKSRDEAADKDSKRQGGQEEEEEHTDSEDEDAEEESQSEGGERQEEQEETDGEELEPWHEWVQRATRVALKEMEKAQVSDWVEAAKRSIWTLAGHISRRKDQRWSTSILDWQPEGGKRAVGKPLRRWNDALEEFTASQADESQPALAERGHWRLLAEDRPEWYAFGEKFWKEKRQNEGGEREGAR